MLHDARLGTLQYSCPLKPTLLARSAPYSRIGLPHAYLGSQGGFAPPQIGR